MSEQTSVPFPDPIHSEADPWSQKYLEDSPAGFTYSFLERHGMQARHFEKLVLPLILKRKNELGKKELNILSIGVATGEELVTLFARTMRALERAKQNPKEWDLSFIGIDHDVDSTAEAELRLAGQSPFVTHSIIEELNSTYRKRVDRMMVILREHAEKCRASCSILLAGALESGSTGLFATQDVITMNAIGLQDDEIQQMGSVLSTQAEDAFLLATKDRYAKASGKHKTYRLPGHYAELAFSIGVPKWAESDVKAKQSD